MQRTVQLLKSLADPTRLRIVTLCREGGDLAVSEFVRILAQSQPRVSRHLRLLTESGALVRVPEGSWVFYRINAEGAALGLIDALISTLPDDDTMLVRDRERLLAVKAERARAAEAYFSDNAASWNELRSMHIDQAEVNAAMLDLMGTSTIAHLLDIGTGTGEMLKLFADRVQRGEGVDLSRDMLGIARTALNDAGLTHCHVRQGDLYSLPFDDATFDAVVVHQVLHYVDDVTGAIVEAARVLVPGGRLVIADFAPHEIEELRTEHQHRRLGFADDDLKQGLERAGVKLEKSTRLGGAPLTVSVWLVQKATGTGKAGAAA